MGSLKTKMNLFTINQTVENHKIYKSLNPETITYNIYWQKIINQKLK